MPVDANGTKVSQAVAIAAWTVVARDTLLTTARRYHSVITYKELASEVQEVSGITTAQRLDYWIGRLLENVAVEATQRGDPPLTALCVHQDGTIGPGYAKAPKSVASDPDADVDLLAAEHRLLCYRAYAEDLPADGGVAALTPQVAARKARRRKTEPVALPVCPIHSMELSTTGVCALCE
ncbi:hypothetical protein [Nocardioides bigeumensis]|uniref:Uncharacterized protein n=1 Tax=Nocardioides bigeumensis TaxID=433657 RepID=A0ABP5KFR0_9ACTN